MIVCPGCQHNNLDGTVFCSDCGMQLSGDNNLITQSIQTANELKLVNEINQTAPYVKDLNTWASLHLLDNGQILPLSDRTEFTLGRISDAQPIMPDIDLAPYKAYASGVSRLHAVLRHEGKQLFIRDLGSSNGTFVNGKRLKENVDTSVSHGDVLSLGKLKIQILI